MGPRQLAGGRFSPFRKVYKGGGVLYNKDGGAAPSAGRALPAL